MESSNADDYSAAEMPSGVVQQKVAFDENLFDQQENNPEMSLQVLANCVNLVNCTILKERDLLPEEYFMPFPVYGEIYGYMLDQTHHQAKKVLNKVNSIDVAIRRRQVYKVAIVVEEQINTQPVETFIWSFSYGEGVTAEIGYNGNKASFNVNYKDMQTTCKEFCKLFNELQQVLKSLLPLPRGMVPSLKVAYRGDPDFSVGFQQVDEFVNVREIGVGSVAFPYNHKFHMSYASEYVADNRSHTSSPASFDVQNEMMNTRDLFFETVNHSPVMEVARKTIELENPDDNERHSPVFADYSLEDDLLHTIPTFSPQRADPEHVLPSEVNEYIQMDDAMEVDGLYGNLEKSPEHRAEMKERRVEMSPKPQVITRKSSGRVSSTKKRGDKVDNSASKIIKKKKNPEEKKMNVIPREEEGIEEPVTMKKQSARRLVAPIKTPVTRKYARMPSLVALSASDSDEDIAEPAREPEMELQDASDEPQAPPKRYGRVSNIRSSVEVRDHVEVTSQTPPIRPAAPEPTEVIEESMETPQRYGRVSRLKNTDEDLTEPERELLTKARYGRVSAVKNSDGDLNEPEKEQQPRRYGFGRSLHPQESEA